MKKGIFIIIISFLSIFATEKSYASTLFQDDFNGINGTTLTAHNNLWQGTPGLNFGVLLNNQVHSSNSSNSDYLIPSLVYLTDYCVQADFDYPLPQTFPPDFFAISTRGDTIDYTHHYFAVLNVYGEVAVDAGNNILFSSTPNISNGAHKFKLCSVGANQSLYLDNTLLTTVIDNTYSFGAPGFDLGNNTPIDNFIVTSTSVNQNTDLTVPLFKQTSNPWQSQEYDTAHLWNPGDPTINAWGCAMTSAAMIFKYHGISKLPDGTLLDPGTLNTWLKNQPDGYVGTGWVNWLALSRLSKLATSINNITTFDALEYHRTQGANISQLTTDINSGVPDILEEPGHFIVAKGINGSTFDINDPYYNLTSLDNTRYNNSFLSIGKFKPAMTDLSYIMFTSDPNVTLTVKDQQGNDVGSSFVQSPITNPLDDTKTNSPIKIFYLPQPDSGTYTITETNTTDPFQFTSYLYDKNGNPKIQTLNGIGNINFTISFDKTNNSNSTITKLITFDSTLQDIKNAQNLNLINNGLATSLTEMLTNAQKQLDKHPETAKTLLNNGIKNLDSHQNQVQLISPEAYDILIYDFTQLKNAF